VAEQGWQGLEEPEAISEQQANQSTIEREELVVEPDPVLEQLHLRLRIFDGVVPSQKFRCL